MHVSEHTQAVLLLTSHFGKSAREELQPLSTNEWARFAVWLKDHGLQPASLLADSPKTVLSGLMDRSVTPHRIEYLLGRGGALGLALEKWQRAGIWVLTRSDPDYPDRLKKRLRNEAPPLFFGCGNQALLSRGGIAVVGSRDASEDDLAFATRFGAEVAAQGQSVVSGGARGIDECAMTGALDREGTVIGVLADSLLRSATSAKYRHHLMNGDLVLISPFNPEAGFNVGNAMNRNRYVYCLADAAVVVSSSKEKGGTWAGAVEDLKERWVPLWIKPQPATTASSGNSQLVQRGGRWLPDKAEVAALVQPQAGAANGRANGDASLLDHVQKDAAPTKNGNAQPSKPEPETPVAERPVENPPPSEQSFYGLFLQRMEALTAKNAFTTEELLDRFDVTKPQLSAWLKRGVEEKKLRKLAKPVRYGWISHIEVQTSMFDAGQ
ncbi:DNA-processing protein DprA [Defluviicoccus vanus]|uniref:DNA-processing protein DprA n=2 Tax=Defluviicoccus vanus TaxID=111831 RepID=A0A7H1N5S0_9PROT|nr:DNA-processing protein DprA [Defluviicoccus vanus]